MLTDDELKAVIWFEVEQSFVEGAIVIKCYFGILLEPVWQASIRINSNLVQRSVIGAAKFHEVFEDSLSDGAIV